MFIPILLHPRFCSCCLLLNILLASLLFALATRPLSATHLFQPVEAVQALLLVSCPFCNIAPLALYCTLKFSPTVINFTDACIAWLAKVLRDAAPYLCCPTTPESTKLAGAANPSLSPFPQLCQSADALQTLMPLILTIPYH